MKRLMLFIPALIVSYGLGRMHDPGWYPSIYAKPQAPTVSWRDYGMNPACNVIDVPADGLMLTLKNMRGVLLVRGDYLTVSDSNFLMYDWSPALWVESGASK